MKSISTFFSTSLVAAIITTGCQSPAHQASSISQNEIRPAEEWARKFHIDYPALRIQAAQDEAAYRVFSLLGLIYDASYSEDFCVDYLKVSLALGDQRAAATIRLLPPDVIARCLGLLSYELGLQADTPGRDWQNFKTKMPELANMVSHSLGE
jgi:hypothetical protein